MDQGTEKKLKFITRAALFYTAMGLAYYFFKENFRDATFFMAGVIFATTNFYILKKGGLILLPLLTSTDTKKISPVIYMLMFGKIIFMGLTIAFLFLGTKVQVIPFVVGMLSILFSVVILGIRLGLKEYRYARA